MPAAQAAGFHSIPVTGSEGRIASAFLEFMEPRGLLLSEVGVGLAPRYAGTLAANRRALVI